MFRWNEVSLQFRELATVVVVAVVINVISSRPVTVANQIENVNVSRNELGINLLCIITEVHISSIEFR